jgi:hypothetical protein
VAESQLKGNVRIRLKHCATMLGAGSSQANIRPVFRTPNIDWCRLPAGTVEGHEDGRVDLSWVVDAPSPWFDLAACFPYGIPQLQETLSDTGKAWRTDSIGVSQAGRPILRLTNDYGTPGGSRPGVYLCARQHAGETPGSWVLDGLLRRLAEQSERAPLVWAVPFVDLDGVEEGAYGKDRFPIDVNRAWGTPPMRHEVLVLQNDLYHWRRSCQPLLALDLHAPGYCEAAGIYAYVPSWDQPHYRELALRWTERFAQSLGAELAAPPFDRVALYASRWDPSATFANFVRRELGVLGLVFETPYALARERVLTREDYRMAGARIADVLIQSQTSQ